MVWPGMFSGLKTESNVKEGNLDTRRDIIDYFRTHACFTLSL